MHAAKLSKRAMVGNNRNMTGRTVKKFDGGTGSRTSAAEELRVRRHGGLLRLHYTVVA